MLSEYKTEIIGISAEIAIADSFNVPINPVYRTRAKNEIIAMTQCIVPYIFREHNIPLPKRHIAEGQNPIDFILSDNRTLSVKTNQRKLGKVAPQNVGQPTSTTYFYHFKTFYNKVPSDYAEKCRLFKNITLREIDQFMRIYWENMFDCDFLVHFYSFINTNGRLNLTPKYIVLDKRDTPQWEHHNFTFTQNATTWNESNTVKYCGVTIGEFQVHNNRDCFKFRFNMDGLSKLIEEGII
jgi:hypothetical protein